MSEAELIVCVGVLMTCQVFITLKQRSAGIMFSLLAAVASGLSIEILLLLLTGLRL
jgi:hypothetical protein